MSALERAVAAAADEEEEEEEEEEEAAAVDRFLSAVAPAGRIPGWLPASPAPDVASEHLGCW